MTSPINNGTVATAATGNDALGYEINKYIAQCLTQTTRINGQFFQLSATVRDDGYIPVEVRRINFYGPDLVVQTLLHPTAPVIIPEPTLTALPLGVGSLDVPPDTAA